jgi:HlyD family secretion protein
MPDRSRRRRRPRWRRPLAVGVGVAVVLVAGGGGVAWALSGRTGERWTTATVAMGSVQQTVSGTGTVASASRRDVAFPVAGTVATVTVGLGDTVTAGEVLASLDPTSLQNALDQASTTLQQAQQQLSDDLQSQTASTTSSASTSSASSSAARSSTPASSSDGTSPAVTRATQDVATAQQALLVAYGAAHAALGASTQALADAQAACTGVTGLDPATVTADGSTPSPSGSATPTPSPSDSSTPTPSPSDSSTPTPTPTSTGSTTVVQVQALIAACQATLSSASQAQAGTTTKQQAVNDAATALDQAVAALQKALGGSGTSGASGAGAGGAGSTGTGSTGTGSSGAGGTQATAPAMGSSSVAATQSRSGSSSLGSSSAASQGRVATAADILSDQAAIDAAQSQVAMATQELTLVTLTSPIAGTVGAVSLSVGQHVQASSTSAVITVLGTDGYVVDLTVPLTSLEKVKVGQTATALVPSTSAQLTGKVSSIGVLNVSSTSTPEYDLVVALDATTDRLFDGSSAQVAIAVAATGQVVTVPTSAVHVSGQGATVRVLANGQVSDVTVQRGAVGAQLTEITSGLTVGQVVVLADRTQQLPSTSTNQGSGLSGLTNRSTTRVGVGGGGGFAPGGGTFRNGG